MGYPVFPAIPKVLGVPDLLRFPSSLSQISSLTAQITDTVMTVTNVNGAQLLADAVLSAPGLIQGTKILNQITGAVGSIGTYALNVAQTFSGDIASEFTPPDISGDDVVEEDGLNVVQQTPTQWGIFKGADAVVLADNVLEVDFKQDWAVSDYPVQQGAFASYDKVYVPFDVRVRFSCGGSQAKRTAFIESIEAIAPTLDLYTVVTPEKVWKSVNVVHQAISRSARDGAGLIQADVWLIQVNEGGTASFVTTQTNNPNATTPGTRPITRPKAAAAKDAVNGGTVQTQTPGAAIDAINQAGAGIL